MGQFFFVIVRIFFENLKFFGFHRFFIVFMGKTFK